MKRPADVDNRPHRPRLAETPANLFINRPHRDMDRVNDADWCVASYFQSTRVVSVDYPRGVQRIPARKCQWIHVPAGHSSYQFKSVHKAFVAYQCLNYVSARDSSSVARDLFACDTSELLASSTSAPRRTNKHDQATNLLLQGALEPRSYGFSTPRSTSVWLLVPDLVAKYGDAIALLDAFATVCNNLGPESTRCTVLVGEDTNAFVVDNYQNLSSDRPSIVVRWRSLSKSPVCVARSLACSYLRSSHEAYMAIQSALAEVENTYAIGLPSTMWKIPDETFILDRFRKMVVATHEAFVRLLHPDPCTMVHSSATSHLEGSVPGLIFSNVVLRVTAWNELSTRSRQESNSASVNADEEGALRSATRGRWCRGAFPALLMCGAGENMVAEAQKFAARSNEGERLWHLRNPVGINEERMRLHILATQFRDTNIERSLTPFAPGCNPHTTPRTLAIETISLRPVDERLISEFCVQPCTPQCLAPENDEQLVSKAVQETLRRLARAAYTVTSNSVKTTDEQMNDMQTSYSSSKTSVQKSITHDDPLNCKEARLGDVMCHAIQKYGDSTSPSVRVLTAAAVFSRLDVTAGDAIDALIKRATE